MTGDTSHDLRKGITEPIEDPVARQKQHDRPAAEREQPFPVADGAGENRIS